jgi:hypothetical protein
MRKQDWFALGMDAPRNRLETVYHYANGLMDVRLTTFAEVKARAAL